ncbi:unnamed protein product [Symbiodinium natans]|uniref:Uncharacterized protein n=1 Tax=Symbiodinium natans TaxID=878477 RepID=A0A812PBL6_9DINO|nr:unnamed protein product [Symbiodinium natans]
MLKKDLRRYEALERQLQHVQDRSKLSELEMLMQGIETEKDALQNNLEVSQARAVSLENQVMQEDLQNRRLRSEMHSSEKQAEKLHGHLQRLDLELSQAGSDRNALEACRTELQAKRLELEMMQAQLRNADAARDHAAEMSSASEADLNAQKALVERLEVRLAGMQDAWEDHAQRLATSNAKARRLEDVLDTQARDLQQQVSRHQVEEELCRKLTTACAELEDEAFQHRQQADALKSETAAQKAKEVTMEAVADRREADLAHLTRLLEEVRGECRDHRASCLRHQATICELQHFQQEVADIRAETGAQIESLENEGRQLALECAELRAALRDAEDVQGRERQALLAEHAELERASALHQSAVSQSTKQRDVLSKQLLELQEEAQEQQYQLAGMARQEATQQHRFGLIQQELTAELGQAAQRGDRAEAALADALAKGAAMLKQNQGLLRDHEEKDAASSERSTKLLSMLGEVQDALAQSQAVANQHQGDAESWKIAHEKLQEELTTVKTRCRSAELQLQDSQGELQVCQSGKERAEQSIRRLQEQVGKVSEELGSLQQAHDRKESGLTNSEMRLSELQMKADRLARERTELEAELEKARKETQQSVAEAQSLLQQKRSEVAELRATRNESRAQQEQLVVLHKDLEDSQRVHEKLQEELANVKTRCRSAEMQLQESQGQLQVCQSGKERAEQSIRRLQEQVGRVSDELGSLQQAHDRKESGLTSSEMRLSELQIRADQASRERTELEAELEKARKDAQQSVAEAQSLLQQKRSEVAELRAARNENRAQQEQLLAVRKDLEESRQSCRGLEQGLSESSAQLQMATEQRRHWTLKREYQERAILGLEEQVCRLNEEMCQSKAQREEQQVKLRSAEHQVMEMEQTTQVMARIQDKALGAHASKEEAAAARLVELEASLSQLRSQLALRESEAQHHERQAESTAARVKVLEAKDAACGKRTAVAEARAAELESKLRQLHATSAHVQEQLGRCRAEQLQLASEKSHLEDQCLACQRRLADAEAQVREAQAEREHWKAQQKVQEDRACQWEAKVGELLRDLHKIQSEGLPQLPSHAGVQERPEVGPLLRQFQTSAARENAVQSCLLAAHGKLEESYMEAQRRLVAAEERLQELREECAYGPPIQMPERVIPPVPEEPRVEPVVGNGWDAQVHEDLRAQAAELRELSQQNDALLAENQGYKDARSTKLPLKRSFLDSTLTFATMKLEASVQRMRGDVEQLSAELQEAEGRLIHAEGAARRAEAVRLGDAGRKRLMSVRQKHVRLQDAYREQGRTRPKGVEEDSIAAIQMATDELKEELSQLREEAAHERANRDHPSVGDSFPVSPLAVKRLHSEELQGAAGGARESEGQASRRQTMLATF